MSEPKENQTDALANILDQAAHTLGEHFQNVQIFCNAPREDIEGGTIYLSKGSGDWFSRYGQVIDWTNHERAVTEAKARDQYRRDKEQGNL